MQLFEHWGLEPIINASGAVTRLGGAPMPEEVLRAFYDAAHESIPLDQLQGLAAREIAQHTGAESGLITAGASAALLLGTAAILARNDLGRMERLPHTADMPNEFVVAREQRNGYDHAVRAAGAHLVDVGFHETVAGAGVRRVEVWEYVAAFNARTAGVLYVYGEDSRPDLARLVEAAHAHQLPVLVDAAGELARRDNLRGILKTGADLVCFSGGKALRGPQATGLLCGRKDLIGSAAVQMLDMDDHPELWDPPADLIDRQQLPTLPRHGIGRSMKVSKEQIFAVLTALRLYAQGDYDRHVADQTRLLQRIAEGIAGTASACELKESPDGQQMPSLEITVRGRELGRNAFEVCRRLRNGSPPVYVGHWLLDQGKLAINPLHLTEARTTALIARLKSELSPG